MLCCSKLASRTGLTVSHRPVVTHGATVVLSHRNASASARQSAPLGSNVGKQGTKSNDHSIASKKAVRGRNLSSSTSRNLAFETTTPPSSTALQITDPLLIYRAKVANGELEEDEEQLRAMVALRNLARTLQDYTPPAHLLGILSSSNYESSSDSAGDPIAGPRPSGPASPEDMKALTKWLATQPSNADLNTLLEENGIPKGIMLTGPPGTGKSMCMDIFYESLPVRYKVRRHYHHLLLEIYRVIWLEAEKRRKALRGGAPPVPLVSTGPGKDGKGFEPSASGPQTMVRPEGDVVDYSHADTGEAVKRATVEPQYGTGVYWKRGGNEGKGAGWRRVLKGMPFFRPDSLNPGMGQPEGIDASDAALLEGESNPAALAMAAGSAASSTTLPLHAAAHLFLTHGYILLFDEVQLVDVASAGILRRVLEAYWRLGGVVIATSNRLPEDLYRNNVQREQLTAFLELFKERCEGVEMRGERDFRRNPAAKWQQLLEEFEAQQKEQEARNATGNSALATYFLASQPDKFNQAVEKALAGRQGEPSFVTVYGRRVTVPFSVPASEHGASVAKFSFNELCDSPLGPADYLTLASTYRTIIVTDMPQLPIALKNQARRLITFLDAAYEAGTELIVSAAASPDNLFFPDAVKESRYNPFLDKPTSEAGDYAGESGAGAASLFMPPGSAFEAEPYDVVDMSARGAPSPFLSPKPGEHYPEEEHLEAQKRTLQERRMHQQGQEELMSDTLIQSETLSEALLDTEEGFRPNVLSYDSSTAMKREPGQMSARQQSEFDERKAAITKKQDDPSTFATLAIFSGEDEKFAFQRAVSRLYEMSHPAWTKRKTWRPFLQSDMSLWSGALDGAAASSAATTTAFSSGVRSSALDGTNHRRAGYEPDFADEASYEAATFPGRHLPRDPRQRAANVDQPAREDASAGSTSGSEQSSGFAAGPVGKRRGKEGPPVVSPVHVWGVREDWGPRSGKWGKGASVFRAGEDGSQEEAAEASSRPSRQRRARQPSPSSD